MIFVPRYLDRMVLGLEQKEAHIQKIEDVLEQQRSKKEELVEGLRQGYANLKDMIAKTKELQKQVRPTTGDLLVSGLALTCWHRTGRGVPWSVIQGNDSKHHWRYQPAVKLPGVSTLVYATGWVAFWPTCWVLFRLRRLSTAPGHSRRPSRNKTCGGKQYLRRPSRALSHAAFAR